MQLFLKLSLSKTYVYTYNEHTDLDDLLQWINDTFGMKNRDYYWMRQGYRYINKSGDEFNYKLTELFLQEQTIYIEPRYSKFAKLEK